MYVCMYGWMDVCVCVVMYVYIYTHVQTYIKPDAGHMRNFAFMQRILVHHARVHTYLRMYMQLHAHATFRTFLTYTHIYTRVCTHTLHTHIHARVHTHILMLNAHTKSLFDIFTLKSWTHFPVDKKMDMHVHTHTYTRHLICI
jgi:hypothetical protein